MGVAGGQPPHEPLSLSSSRLFGWFIVVVGEKKVFPKRSWKRFTTAFYDDATRDKEELPKSN